MSASTAKIIKWATAGCSIAIIAVIGCLACFKGHKNHRKDKTVATQTAKRQNERKRRDTSKAKPSAPAIAKETTVYGQDVYPTSLSYAIKATVRSQGAPAPESAIKCWIENFGLCHPEMQIIYNKSVITNGGEGQTVQFPVNLMNNAAGFFRPAFKAPAGVVVGNIEVTELPIPNGEPELTIVEGTILECSALPDPEKSDYPDCRFTCHFKGNSIVKGKPCPQELSLILEGFADRKLLGTKDLKPGDRVICIAFPFNKLPQEKQTTQQADDLNLFSLESYYAIDIRKINEFSDLPGTPASGIVFTDASNEPYVSVFERHINPPIKDEFRKAQQEAIAEELQKIEAMLAPYTPEKIAELRQRFAQVWEAEKAKDPPGYNRVVRKDKDGKDKEYVWRNVENSFWALPSNYRLPNYKEEPIAPYNLEALIALRDFLEANGCQLLISPVPYFHEIAARVINPEFRTAPDFQTAYMAMQLLKHGIETFYPSKTLVDNFNRYPWAFFYPDNSHPHDTTQDIMSDIVAQKLSRYHFSKSLDPQYFSIKLVPRPKEDFRFPKNCNIGNNTPNALILCRQVLYYNRVISFNNNSHILVNGNSYMTFPIGSGSFPSLLSLKLNSDIQRLWCSMFGPMTTNLQLLFFSPEKMLRHKGIVILVMGTQHFCTQNVFNNIRIMDNHAKIMSRKKLISVYAVKSNLSVDNKTKNGKEEFYQRNISPNFINIASNEPMTLTNNTIANIDINKHITIAIPTCLCTGRSAKYIINGQETIIQKTDDRYRHHQNIFCELPAGTERLKVEIVGKPGTILSIRNIQVYQ